VKHCSDVGCESKMSGGRQSSNEVQIVVEPTTQTT